MLTASTWDEKFFACQCPNMDRVTFQPRYVSGVSPACCLLGGCGEQRSWDPDFHGGTSPPSYQIYQDNRHLVIRVMFIFKHQDNRHCHHDD